MSTIARFTRYLSVLLVAVVLSACAIALPPTTATDPSPNAALERFVDDLTVALIQRDYTQLQALMDTSFTLAQWRSEGVERPPAIAVMNLRDRYLGAGSVLVFPTAVDLTTLLDGTEPYRMADPATPIVHALYVTGLGMQQDDEALLMVAQRTDGSFYWHSILLASGGFQPDAGAMGEPVGDTIAAADVASSAIAPIAATTPVVTATAVIPVRAAMLPIPTIATKTLTTTLAEAAPSRVALTEAHPAAKFRGVLRPAQSRLYILRASAGQTMTVAVASTSDVANFSITGIDDGQPYKRLADESRTWQETLPATQDYLITVAATVALPYELTITIDSAAAMAEIATIP